MHTADPALLAGKDTDPAASTATSKTAPARADQSPGPARVQRSDAARESGGRREQAGASARLSYVPKVAVSGSRRFPGRSEVASAAGVLEDFAGLPKTDDGEVEATGCRVLVGPGGVQVQVDAGVFGPAPDPPPLRDEDSEREAREVTTWSAKSRANMVRRLAMLDYTPMVDPERLLTMVTLTYPGCDPETVAADHQAERRHVCTKACPWYDVAPDGKAVKRHLETWRKRYERTWAESWRGVWKLEFQSRGAPHLHLCMLLPNGATESRVKRLDGLHFPDWLARSWADVVGHPDATVRHRHEVAGTHVGFREGIVSTDPKRVAVYFTKHAAPHMSSKEYQNEPPALWVENGATPGRFWGSFGLEAVEVAVEVSKEQVLTLRRTLRRWSRSRTAYSRNGEVTIRPAVERITVERNRVNMTTGELKTIKRKTTRRVRRYASGRVTGGFSLFNDAPQVAIRLAQVLHDGTAAEPGGFARWAASELR